MDEKDLEKLVNDYESSIDERISLILKKVAETEEYKSKYKRYSNLFQSIIEQVDKKDVEDLTASLYSICSVENNYIYLQGFKDGVLLNEKLA